MRTPEYESRIIHSSTARFPLRSEQEIFWERCLPQHLFRNARSVETAHGPEEIVWVDKFFDGFFTNYIGGYIDNLAKYYPQGAEAAKDITPALKELLPALLTCPIIKNQEFISGVAQSMLYYWVTQQIFSEGKLPHWHWDFRPHYAKQEGILETSGQERAAKFMRSLAGDADIDAKWGMNGTGMKEVVEWFYAELKEKYGGKISDLRDSVSTPDTKISKDYTGEAFDFVFSDHIRIRINGGPLPHNQAIEIFSIWIYDRQGEVLEGDGNISQFGRRLYHFEARNILETAEAQNQDLRGGMTYSQDYSTVTTFSDSGELWFAVSRQAVESMLYQDKIVIKPEQINFEGPDMRRAAMMTETPPRMARMRLCFDLGFVWIRDESGEFKGILPLPQLNFVFPYLFNTFDLGDRLRELAIFGIGINPDRLWLFQQELWVMLGKHPGYAIDFIQFGELYRVISRLKDKKPQDFDDIRASLPLVVQKTEAVAGPRIETRHDPRFQLEQMKLYLAGDEIDGAERVMRALGAGPGDEVEFFLSLFDPKPEEAVRKVDISEDRKERSPYTKRLRLAVPNTQGRMTNVDLASDTPLTDIQLVIISRFLSGYALPIRELFTRGIRWDRVINMAMKGTLLETEIKRARRFSLLNRERLSMLWFRKSNMGILMEILNSYPYLTPRNLKRTYLLLTRGKFTEPSSRQDELQFERMLFDLIVSGFLQRQTLKRIEQSTGDIVDVEFLTLRYPFELNYWNILRREHDFINHWVRHPAIRDMSRERATKLLKDTCNFLNHHYIPSAQALESMSSHDWSILRENIRLPDESDPIWDFVNVLMQVCTEYLKMT